MSRLVFPPLVYEPEGSALPALHLIPRGGVACVHCGQTKYAMGVNYTNHTQFFDDYARHHEETGMWTSKTHGIELFQPCTPQPGVGADSPPGGERHHANVRTWEPSVSNVDAIRARVIEAANHYAVLDVPPGAEEGVIKAAHRGLARMFHPDVAPDPENAEVMTKVNVAYSALISKPSRKKYDAIHSTERTFCLKCKGSGAVLKRRGFAEARQSLCTQCGGTGLCAPCAP